MIRPPARRWNNRAMSPADLARRQRCRALELAVVLGLLLPIFSRTWITLGVGLAGAAIALVTHRRYCRGV